MLVISAADYLQTAIALFGDTLLAEGSLKRSIRH
jgi:hypothetical protein